MSLLSTMIGLGDVTHSRAGRELSTSMYDLLGFIINLGHRYWSFIK